MSGRPTSRSTILTWLVVVVALLGLLISLPSVGHAAPITFNLESLAISTSTSITSTVGGLTLTVHRLDNVIFEIRDISGLVGGPPAFGTRSISNFDGPFGPGAELILSFSSPISSGAISFGDFDVDDDGTVTLAAFSGANGSGSNLGSSSVLYPASLDFSVQGDAAIRTLTVSAVGIQSLTILSNGTFPNSLFFDNIVADTVPAPVPEPTSSLLLGSGLVFAVLSRRVRRR